MEYLRVKVYKVSNILKLFNFQTVFCSVKDFRDEKIKQENEKSFHLNLKKDYVVEIVKYTLKHK